MRMRTSEGGLSRAQRDHVALATARRASIEDARNPLSPTNSKKTCFQKQVFFSSAICSISSHSLIVAQNRHFAFWLSSCGDIQLHENKSIILRSDRLSLTGNTNWC